MTLGETLYESWAPADSVWSPWQKPVLFTQVVLALLEKDPPVVAGTPAGAAPPAPEQWQSVDMSWAPPASQKTAVVVDLPAEAPLWTGVALAARGYQPVVLYNCCDGPSAVLDLAGAMRALARGAEALKHAPRPRADAPPAFLLDARRTAGDRKPAPGLFDNRWVVLPQDFPSATFLKSQGVGKVLLVHDAGERPREDLAHVLLRWQEAGIPVESAGQGGRIAEMRVERPPRFRAAWYALLVVAGLRPNSAGGFGSIVPVPTQGGG